MRHVLLVEDDVPLRSAIEQVLVEAGYRVSLAGNGMDALLQMSQKPHPDLIVLDLMMPTLSGWEFLSELRAHPQTTQTPVLVASAFNNAPFGVHVDGFIQKPFGVGDFLEKVNELIHPTRAVC